MAQQVQVLERTITKTVTINYLLYLPPDYDDAGDKRWPVMLFLHGAGERGDDLEKVRAHGPPKLVAEGRDFPFIIVSPQCPQDIWWDLVALDVLLYEVIEKHIVDEDRIYVTGLSMGGFGTWNLALTSPHRFAAIAPVCGGGNPHRISLIKHLPVWVFHGAKDSVVPVQKSEEMVEALKACGGDVRFTVYPEADHDSWTATYNNPELYEWLLQHRRVVSQP